MNLLTFLRKESTAPITAIFVMTTVSGIANGAILAIVNAAAEKVTQDGVSFRYLAMFVIAIMTFILTKKFALINSTTLVENVITKVRLRIIDKIRNSELIFLEKVGKSEIYTAVTQNTMTVSEAATATINAGQATIMLFFCLIYLAWLSLSAFFLTLILVGAAIAMYLNSQKALRENIRRAVHKETEFFESLNHILDGFKEVKINRKKSDDIFYNYLTEISQSAQRLKIETAVQFLINYIFSQSFFYILIGGIVFILPLLSGAYSDVIIKTTAVILFIISPLEALVGAIPVFAKANVAVDNLHRLEEDLDMAKSGVADDKPSFYEDAPEFSSIELRAVQFHYKDRNQSTLFSVGPFDLTVRKGEIIFIVGGNGSGKSTLMKLLTGLYYPDSGHIALNGKALDRETYNAYRELFSIIFTDFHLFDRLYGLEGTDEARLGDLIKLMELADKTSYSDGRFTNTNLSTGQKKRLALIISYLEDKQICVFDEWAADQDPEFRKFFYEKILPSLREQGKTIIAVTHDDKYFYAADRVIKMEYGKIIEDSEKAGPDTL